MDNKTEFTFKYYFTMLTFVLLIFARPICEVAAGQDAPKPSAPKSDSTHPEYVIGMGDELEIMIWKEPDLNQTLSVRIDGQISLPLVGEVQAAGKTIRELKKILEEKYGSVITDPAVSVMLTQSKSWRYYIIGQISKPGEFPIDFPLTILQAIARSGGFLEWAKKDRISIVHREGDKETIFPFNYEALVNGQNLQQNALVKPGDTIIIP